MTILFTSDNHFHHENILKFGRGDGQFQSIAHHDQILCNNWWVTVPENATVYVLGDVALGDTYKSLQLFKNLPGHKILIPGNHDKIFSGNSKTHIEKWWKVYEEVGFEIYPEISEINISTETKGEVPVLLSHFPYETTEFENSKKDKFKNQRPIFEKKPLIHGHTHSKNIFNPNNIYEFHVGVDAHNFAPVPEKEISDWLESLFERKIV